MRIHTDLRPSVPPEFSAFPTSGSVYPQCPKYLQIRSEGSKTLLFEVFIARHP